MIGDGMYIVLDLLNRNVYSSELCYECMSLDDNEDKHEWMGFTYRESQLKVIK